MSPGNRRRHEVGHADVGRIGVGSAAELRDVEEAERVEPVVDGDGDDIVMTRQPGAIFDASSYAEPNENPPPWM